MCKMRRLVIVGSAAAVVAGCAGSQLPAWAPAGNSYNALAATSAGQNHSRVVPNTTGRDLLYAVGGCGGTCVLSYPAGKLVGKLSTFGFADCVDSAGNVFITSDSKVVEYAHGGTRPIATLSLPGQAANSCSIDPTTGNLAVIFRGSGVDVAIFSQAQGMPKIYSSQINSGDCGYDGAGNLFVDGYSGRQVGFSELPAGGTQFQQLTISKSAAAPPAQVQWDGKFITYESVYHNNIEISRVRLIGSVLNIVGVTQFTTKGNAGLSWIAGDKVFVPYRGHEFAGTQIDVWRYPKGGKPVQRITDFGKYQRKTLRLSGVTLSVVSLR